MALTRVLVGAHYPTDVIAGVLLGAIIADTTWFGAAHLPIERFLAKRRPRHEKLNDPST